MEPADLRTLDAIHLATASLFGESLHLSPCSAVPRTCTVVGGVCKPPSSAKTPGSIDTGCTDERCDCIGASSTQQDRLRQLPGDLVPKLRRVLTLLDEARNPGDLAAQPGYRLHPLKGDMVGLWSIRVSGIWRVVFRFKDNEAVDVDLVDYH